MRYLQPFLIIHPVDSESNLFANDILCLFIGSQSQEDRLTKLVVVCSFGKLALGDKHGFNPTGNAS